MYRFLLSLGFATLMLASCQNTPKTAADATTATETAAPEQAPVSMELVEQTVVKLNSGREQALDLRNQVDQLAAGVKAKNKEAIDAIYNDLEGIMAKEGKMIGDLRALANGGEQAANASEDVSSTPVDQNTVKDYSESVDRYNLLLQEVQKKIDALKGGN
ncbi:MAG: hypothetical protein IT261_03310 [Saprospiraceae bacterium]|nr:hypothetical protein [Saprospiraceae bacterium]